MAEYVARVRLYHTLDRSKIVKEGDPAAAFLVVGEGTVLPEAEVQRLGLAGYMEVQQPQSALERERAALADAEARGAHYEAQSRRGAIDRLEHGEAPQAAPIPDVSGRGVVPTASVPTPKAERRAVVREAPKAEPPKGGDEAGAKKG